jgi:hypothetical protein
VASSTWGRPSAFLVSLVRCGARRPGRCGRSSARVQRGVVLGQVRIPGVAEDGLDEVEVGHHATGHDEADLEALLGGHPVDVGDDGGTQQQRHEALGRAFGVGGPRQLQGLGRCVERGGEDTGSDIAIDGDLLVGDRQPALGEVEDARGGAAVVGRVVQDAVEEPVARQQFRAERVTVNGERQFPSHAGLVQDQGAAGELR